MIDKKVKSIIFAAFSLKNIVKNIIISEYDKENIKIRNKFESNWTNNSLDLNINSKYIIDKNNKTNNLKEAKSSFFIKITTCRRILYKINEKEPIRN